MTLLSLLAVLGGCFLTLCWVAWRFFALPQRVVTDPTTVPVQVASIDIKKHQWFRLFAERCKKSLWLRWLTHWSVLLAILIGITAVLGVLTFSKNIAPDPLQALDLYRQQHIQAALNPEKLVPPPLLPPSLFAGTERPALETADREWGKMHPEFVQVVLRLFTKIQERGYSFALLEGYRSPERQEKLASMGNHVTSARAFQSKHQYGLAVDIAPLKDGKIIISERDPWAMQAYNVLGEEAEKMGLIWGGRWWFKDFGHVEAPGTIQANLELGK